MRSPGTVRRFEILFFYVFHNFEKAKGWETHESKRIINFRKKYFFTFQWKCSNGSVVGWKSIAASKATSFPKTQRLQRGSGWCMVFRIRLSFSLCRSSNIYLWHTFYTFSNINNFLSAAYEESIYNKRNLLYGRSIFHFLLSTFSLCVQD